MKQRDKALCIASEHYYILDFQTQFHSFLSELLLSLVTNVSLKELIEFKSRMTESLMLKGMDSDSLTYQCLF